MRELRNAQESREESEQSAWPSLALAYELVPGLEGLSAFACRREVGVRGGRRSHGLEESGHAPTGDRPRTHRSLDRAGRLRRLQRNEGKGLGHEHVPPLLRPQAQPGEDRAGQLCRAEDPLRDAHRPCGARCRCRLERAPGGRSRLPSGRVAGGFLGPHRQALERDLRRAERPRVPAAVRNDCQQRIHQRSSRLAGGEHADSRPDRGGQRQPDRLRPLREREEHRPRLQHDAELRRLRGARRPGGGRLPGQRGQRPLSLVR